MDLCCDFRFLILATPRFSWHGIPQRFESSTDKKVLYLAEAHSLCDGVVVDAGAAPNDNCASEVVAAMMTYAQTCRKHNMTARGSL